MHSIVLQKKICLDHDVYLLEFNLPSDFHWIPGQNIVMILPHHDQDAHGIARALSMASTPSEGRLWFVTHIADTGTSFKRALGRLAVGDSVQITDPVGEFVYVNTGHKHHFLAAGVGGGAVRSLLMDADHSGKKLKGSLYYYATRDGYWPFRNDLEGLSQRHPDFSIRFLGPLYTGEQGKIKEVEIRKGDLCYFSGVYAREVSSIKETPDLESGNQEIREEMRQLAGLVSFGE